VKKYGDESNPPHNFINEISVLVGISRYLALTYDISKICSFDLSDNTRLVLWRLANKVSNSPGN
jgi:hypothetical protein